MSPFSLGVFMTCLLLLNKIIEKVIMSENNSQSSTNVNQFNRFLNNNQGFIHQKYDKYFDSDFSVSALPLQENTEKCLQFIYDIFSFHKYQSNPKLNNTLRQGLSANVREFVAFTETSRGTADVVFNREEAVKLLKYCIENNEMFAVKYDRKNKKKNEAAEQPQTQQIEKVQEERKQVTKTFVIHKEEPVVEQPKVQTNEVAQEPEEAPKEAQTVQQKQQKEQKYIVAERMAFSSNQFQSIEPVRPKHTNTELIKRQLKGIFEFYCKQKQNVTPASTFDNINQKSQTMNLGKFLYFAGAVNIVQSKEKSASEGNLDRKVVTSVFKRYAEGHSLVDFKVFMAIMEDLQKKDDSIFSRLGLGEEGPRAKIKMLQNLKPWNLPFYTKDQEGRMKSFQGKTFIPKLTSHSGKNEESLKEQLLSRKERPYQDGSKTIFKGRAQSKLGSVEQDGKETLGYTLKLGDSHMAPEAQQLKFLSKLITHEQNDQIFLKDYYVPSRKNMNSNKQKPLSGTFDQSNRYAKHEDQSTMSKQFGKNPGDLTSRPVKQSLILPIIKQRQNPAIQSQRRSLGADRNFASKF